MLMTDDKRSIYIDTTEVHDGILDHQVEECPTCKGELITQFGLAGGGMGVYGFCPQCERVIWKCITDD
jgi:hypothetical protein